MSLLNDLRLRMGWYPEPELFMAELMKEANQEKISAAIAEQVALVGSQSLYERINNNFKEMRFEAFLAKVKLKIWFDISFLSWSGALQPLQLEREILPQ